MLCGSKLAKRDRIRTMERFCSHGAGSKLDVNFGAAVIKKPATKHRKNPPDMISG
nr:hypothetical protein CKG001_22630 [Bdellovibrio sp. CKG001]BFD63568.1 hypothetical protein BdHM001_22490 [Bdellovibrio sp. HM001]BFD66278.1 hypothetical protein HAGR004_13000 [Bdellovibrio sp. HAGR004]